MEYIYSHSQFHFLFILFFFFGFPFILLTILLLLFYFSAPHIFREHTKIDADISVDNIFEKTLSVNSKCIRFVEPTCTHSLPTFIMSVRGHEDRKYARRRRKKCSKTKNFHKFDFILKKFVNIARKKIR